MSYWGVLEPRGSKHTIAILAYGGAFFPVSGQCGFTDVPVVTQNPYVKGCIVSPLPTKAIPPSIACSYSGPPGQCLSPSWDCKHLAPLLTMGSGDSWKRAAISWGPSCGLR